MTWAKGGVASLVWHEIAGISDLAGSEFGRRCQVRWAAWREIGTGCGVVAVCAQPRWIGPDVETLKSA